jgi:hypothetical protein
LSRKIDGKIETSTDKVDKENPAGKRSGTKHWHLFLPLTPISGERNGENSFYITRDRTGRADQKY